MDELVLAAPDQIGDTLLATPAIRSWKLAHPGGRLTVWCRDEGGPWQVLQHNPHVDTLSVLDDAAASRLPGKHVRLDPDAALQRCWTTGQSFASAYGHMLGVEIDSLKYDYAITPDERDAADQALATLGEGKPVVVVARHSVSCMSNHPAVRRANKCVDNVYWVHCADDLTRRGYVPVAVGRQDEADDPRYRRWPGKTLYGASLRLVAALCARSAGVLTVDNGVRHLAAAAGAHVYTLSGAIPLAIISCVPVRDGQRVDEEFRDVRDVTMRTLSRGAKRLGL
ncbi:MAG TPA: glycosyltransferase family 9 protein [Casimicrobiaceae bacterium]|nr:glycosyltransferase family 9 protein [Casimicrobiaceae bacterium]